MNLFDYHNVRSLIVLAVCFAQAVVGVLTPESVEISASFPIENQFGVVFNGQPNKILLKVLNMGKHPVEDVLRIHSVWNEFREVGGKERLLRKGNPTPSKRTLAPNANAYTIPYHFSSEQKEGNTNLKVWVEWSGPKGRKFQALAYDSTVTVQEPPTRWFDPQLILLYIILASGFGTVGYMAYVSYLGPIKSTQNFSKKTLKGKALGEGSATSTPKVATPTGGAYEEEWIPAGHPVRSSNKSAAESGEETSGTEGKPRRRKR